ncbi:MAG: hypothetical protein ACYC9O_11160 [Candidatus Latescibacterota bacterium]
MSGEIVKYSQSSLPELREVAKLFAESGLFPDTRNMAAAFVKIQTGKELGISAMASMTGIAIIGGKPVVGANIVAAKVKMAGYNYRVKRLDNQGCVIEFFDRDGSSMGISSFSEEDARAAGLLNKDNWKKYARNMYFSRAVSNGQRWYCPDALGGSVVYTPDELGAKVNADGDPVTDSGGNAIMDAEYTEVAPEEGTAQEEEPFSEGPNQRLRRDITDWILEMVNGDTEKAIAILEEESAFFDKKNQKHVSGVRSTNALKAIRLQIVHGKIKTRFEKWRTETYAQGEGGDDAEA